MNNQRSFMDRVAKELNIQDQEGWYKIKWSILEKHGATPLVQHKYNNSPTKLLTSVYPEYQND